MYKYQEFPRYVALIAGGTEELGAEELAELGATSITQAYRGLLFDADRSTLYRINYASRLVSRILAPLTSFDCHNPDYLYRKAMTIEWTDFISVDDTFGVFANVSNSKIRHSKYAALRIKDAVVDQFREQTGRRPNVDTHDPDLWIGLHLENNHATISIDTSGGPLHRRGYRQAAGGAPMQETVAAAVIRYSGWNGDRPLYDPMCGSGTLLTEALMAYCRIPSAYFRKHFGFENLPDYDAGAWRQVRMDLDGQIRPLPEGLIAGSDRDDEMVSIARRNLSALPGGNRVEIRQKDYRSLSGFSNTTLVMNPPYGIRMGQSDQMSDFYKTLGDFLKQKCTGSTAFIYVGDRSLLKQVGLRPAWKKPLVNGALDGRLARYDLY